MGLDYEQYCTQIPVQARLVREHMAGTDLAVPVPSCPGWNVGQLVRHLGGAHRESETMIRTGATDPDAEDFRHPTHDSGDPDELGSWLVQGAEALAKTLREAGPEKPIAGPLPGSTATFTARRMAHETAIHRSDADLALGVQYRLDEDVAIDAIDEWMELGSLPLHFEVHPWMRELLGPGRTLHFHATDSASNAEWLIDLTGEVITWRRAHEKAAVAVRGPLLELLLFIYKRTPVNGPGIEVLGDAQLLDFWLERVSFG